MTEIRKGQAPAVLSRQVFHERFMQSFMDPAFRAEEEAISRVEAIAWDAYLEGRKAPITRKAGAGYADKAMQAEVRNVASAVANAVRALRAGTLSQPDKGLSRPRPK